MGTHRRHEWLRRYLPGGRNLGAGKGMVPMERLHRWSERRSIRRWYHVRDWRTARNLWLRDMLDGTGIAQLFPPQEVAR